MEQEEPLLVPENEERIRDFITRERFVRELERVSYIAFPMAVVSLSQYMLLAVSMMMLGHLGELALSSAAIATSLTNVTGFSFIFGMAYALETLCGQAYGAENYQKVGTYTYGAVIWLLLACLPVCLLWTYTDKLLILTGQDPEISLEAEMTPFLCASIVTDGLQAVLSGVARGSGWQHLGAYVNLGAYYIIGIPVALLLGFVLRLKGEGLWSGLIAGSLVQCILLVLITCRTDWKKLAMEARQRIFEGKIPNHNDLI